MPQKSGRNNKIKITLSNRKHKESHSIEKFLKLRKRHKNDLILNRQIICLIKKLHLYLKFSN